MWQNFTLPLNMKKTQLVLIRLGNLGTCDLWCNTGLETQDNTTLLTCTSLKNWSIKKRIKNRHKRQEFWIIKRQNTNNVKFTLVGRSEFKQLIVYQSVQ